MRGRRKTFEEKLAEFTQLREEAHRKVDTLTRQQLRKFLKRNGREWTGVSPQPNKEK